MSTAVWDEVRSFIALVVWVVRLVRKIGEAGMASFAHRCQVVKVTLLAKSNKIDSNFQNISKESEL